MELYIIIIAVITAVGILISSIMNAKSAKTNINGIIIMALAGVCAVFFALFGFKFNSFTVYLLFIVMVAVLLLMVFLLMQFIHHKIEKAAKACADGDTGRPVNKLSVRARKLSAGEIIPAQDDSVRSYPENGAEISVAAASELASFGEQAQDPEEAAGELQAMETYETAEAEDGTDAAAVQPEMTIESDENEKEIESVPKEDDPSAAYSYIASESRLEDNETVETLEQEEFIPDETGLKEESRETSTGGQEELEETGEGPVLYETGSGYASESMALSADESGQENVTAEWNIEDGREESQTEETIAISADAGPLEEKEENISGAEQAAPEETEKEKSVLHKAAVLKEQGKYLVAYSLFKSAAQNVQNIKFVELQMLDCLVLAGQTEDASRAMFGILNRKYDLTAQEKFRLKEIMTILHNADRQKTV